MMYGWNGPWMAGMMGFTWIPALFCMLLVGVVVYFVFRLLSRGGADQHGELRILRERYARGEIDQSEFQRIQHDLKNRR